LDRNLFKRKFGWTGVKVPLIGQGTWMIEGDQDTESQAVKTLRLDLDLGMSHIDTAEMYGHGRAEELVAEAIADRRDQVFLTSKVLPSNATYEGTIKACKMSLERLKTNWLDLYLLHWPSRYPISETMHAMEKLVSEGLVLFIGVSNFDLDKLNMVDQTLKNEQIACNQVLYHLSDREIEKRLIPYCEEREIDVVGYAPFGHGSFPSCQSHGGKVLAKIAKLHNRTPRQVALNFLTRHPCLFTIPKTLNPERVKENSGGMGWKLTDEDIMTIDSTFPLPSHDTQLGII
jgi:diketogulonate reductase-like aldo/keto reductase